jgi:lambda family phage portal protein
VKTYKPPKSVTFSKSPLHSQLFPKSLYELLPHRSYSDVSDGTTVSILATERLKRLARYLEQNHDLSRGALDRLVQFIVGDAGIGIDPTPKTFSGSIHQETQKILLSLWRDWTHNPEVTGTHDWVSVQRLLCRTWLRDGEALVQKIVGTLPTLSHDTEVQLSLELIESDLLPIYYNDIEKNITAGIEQNQWGRAIAYWIYKKHPGSPTGFNADIKRVSAANIIFLKLIDRIGQLRGVTVFSSVVRRLNDVFEYENSERYAAKLAANLTGVLKTDNPEIYESDAPRELNLQPGSILDNLRPGESLDIISSNRPNTQLENFRLGQLKAASAGVGLSGSSFSRVYDGSYSSQRQEQVESVGGYKGTSRLFIGQFIRPIWHLFTDTALLQNKIPISKDLDISTLNHCQYQLPVMPWIDPLKEASAQNQMLGNFLTSPQTIIRERGGTPSEVLTQWEQWQKMLEIHNLTTGIKS